MKLDALVRWLHARFVQSGTIPAFDGDSLYQALSFLNGLDGAEMPAPHKEAYQAGVEIAEELPRSPLAKAVARRSYAALEDLDTVLFLMEDNGEAYTPLAVRSLLTHHFWDLKTAALGSDENCIYIDLVTAINAATERTRTVCWMLVGGVGTQDIGTFFQTHGSRAVRRAATEIAARMEGTYVAQSKRQRRKHNDHHRQQRPDADPRREA